ncbi:MAG TPA: asparaginase [Aestuariivirgaceae bacterium]|jgi:L-asparaginase II
MKVAPSKAFRYSTRKFMDEPIPNPVLVEIHRGSAVESRHRGSFCVVGANGKTVAAAGTIDQPVFPRSAIKAFQALPLIETGAADLIGLTPEEIALLCSSHSGEADHVRVAYSILHKAGMREEQLECGAHPPQDHAALRELIKSGSEPRVIHNNCSGKHAGMLALAARLGVEPSGYIDPDHPVQRTIAQVLDELCDVQTRNLPRAIDGCSVPTWGLPLRNLALGFQRFASGETLDARRRNAASRILSAVRAHPFMVAGTKRFCTRLMETSPSVFVKTGAEGVFCAAIPHAGLGIALKCEDGSARASETATAALIASLDVWTAAERDQFRPFIEVTLKNWREMEVGKISAARMLSG